MSSEHYIRINVRASHSSSPVLPPADEEQQDHDDQRRGVEDLHQPVACVGEHDAHPLDSESSQRPRLVKPIITASIQYCERTAFCVAPKSTRARSWATISAATWPATSVAICTQRIATAESRL